jgi:hypothetical protein
MLRTFQLSLAATQQRLSDVYGGADVPGNEVAKDDIPYRQVILQAATAAAYVGSDPATLSTTVYGNKIAIDGSLVLGPFDQGPIKLSDLYVLGASCVLHVTGIPF